MGNIIRREKLQKAKGKPNETGTKIEGLRYRSLFSVSVEEKPKKERNSDERRMVKVDGNNVNSLIKMVHDNVISQKLIFNGPFGQRRCVYMDHTASGLPLKCIEDFIQDHVLPYYGNTHTTATVTSSQTTHYREEARDIIRDTVGANNDDVVIFCGSGCTRAIHKLVNVLASNDRQLVVFVGPYEHHSNILPWKERNAQMIFVPETRAGLFDIDFLESQLKVEAIKAQKKNKLLIGAFSVASNVTGIAVDDIRITKLMHTYGALSCWDYSSAASHVEIYMNPGETALTHKDAIYFSGHKFIGGPQTPGVLVAKRLLFDEKRASDGGGGGSVFFVTKEFHSYLKDVEAREEAGTPAIVESIRLGLVFHLKNEISAKNILTIEQSYVRMMMERWSKVPEIKILADNNCPRTATISFLIRQLNIGLYLHHNFVVALLNDLFGIQTRGSCGCAGPYSQSLLGIDLRLANKYKDLLLDAKHSFCRDAFHCSDVESPCEIFKPGFVRVSTSYCSSKEDVEYVIEAVEFVAKRGYMLLPYYKCSVTTGAYYAKDMLQHHNQLKSVVFDAEGINFNKASAKSDDDDDASHCPNYEACLQYAENLVNKIRDTGSRIPVEEPFDEFNSELRWFVHQKEASDLLEGSRNFTPKMPPFTAASYDSVNSDYLHSITPNSVLDQLCVRY